MTIIICIFMVEGFWGFFLLLSDCATMSWL